MRSKLTIDIQTKFIKDNQKCYLLFPGRGYRFYNKMEASERIFLDIPGFQLNSDEVISEIDDLSQRVILSERIRKWHDKGAVKEDEPSRNLAELGEVKPTKGQLQLAGRVRNFFSTLKIGDIIIVPCKAFEGEVLFGEIISEEIHKTRHPNYGADLIPSLKVKWLHRIQRSKVPTWLNHKIPNQNPLRSLERSHFPFVFDQMYGRYFFNDQFTCKLSITSKKFSSLDDFLIQQLLLFTTALHERVNDDIVGDVQKQAIAITATKISHSSDIPELRISINSPGYLSVGAKTIVPLLYIVFVAIAGASEFANAAEFDAINVIIENSMDSSELSKQCISEIQTETKDEMAMMGYNKWQEYCQISEQSKMNNGLETGITVKSTQE